MDNEEIQGVKFSEFPSATPDNADEVVGLHAEDNARFSVANFILAIRQGLVNLFVPQTRTINNKALSSDISLNASDVGAVNTSAVGAADGVASLDSNGKVPGTQLDLSGKQSTITASGILKGDGAGGVSAAVAGTDYQAPLTIDATPTENSTNPVQSGGVYTDVRTRVPNYGKGVNLLRNWYFVGGGTGRGVFPVNQRGATTLNVGSTYFVDGWVTRNTTGSVAISSSGLSITTPSGLGARFALFQHIQLGNYAGKPLTLSVLDSTKVYSATVGSLSITGTSTRVIQISLDDGGLAELFVSTSDCYISLSSGIGKTSVYQAIKLELGSEQTLAHQENGAWVLNEIPDYEYELYRCITSTADSTDTYANKSLATEQQLAYVETGTTASRAYAVGEYFCLNGLLYRVTAAISSGGTFTPGTNCEQATVSDSFESTWTFIEEKTGTASISLPPSWKELLADVYYDNIHWPIHVKRDTLKGSNNYFRHGYYYNSTYNGGCSVYVGNTVAYLQSCYTGGTARTNDTIVRFYWR